MNANRAEERWDAFADPTRRQIVARLVERPQAVGELASQLPVSRSAVSQHLRVLRDAGLVSERPEGTRRIYRVNPAALEALRDQIDTYWRRTLEGYSDLFAPDNNAEESS